MPVNTGTRFFQHISFSVPCTRWAYSEHRPSSCVLRTYHNALHNSAFHIWSNSMQSAYFLCLSPFLFSRRRVLLKPFGNQTKQALYFNPATFPNQPTLQDGHMYLPPCIPARPNILWRVHRLHQIDSIQENEATNG